MEHSEKPQHLDQSNKVFWQKASKWTKDFSVSSKERWFLSVQTIHIKQLGTIGVQAIQGVHDGEHEEKHKQTNSNKEQEKT